MNRIKSREVCLQLAYQMNITKENAKEVLDNFFEEHEANLDELDLEYIKRILKTVDEQKEVIDSLIESNLVNWKLNRISKVNLSILRIAICEIKFMEDIPDKVAVNEALELAKKFSDEKSVSFINGVLDKMIMK